MSPAPIPPPKRVIVFGAGALGSLFGAQLSAQVPVVLVGRQAHVEAIQAHGLTIESTDSAGQTVARTVQGPQLQAASQVPALQTGDVVGVFCKAADTAEAAVTISQALLARRNVAADRATQTESLSIWTFQNGAGNDAVLLTGIHDRIQGMNPEVHAGIASQGATLRAPGCVADFGGGYVMPDTGPGRALGGLMARAGMAVRFSSDMPAEFWTKLAINCVVNPLTLLLQRRNKFILTPELAALRHAVVREVVAVAAAEKVRLNADEVIAKMEAAMAVSLNYSSMYQDWLRYQERRAGWEQAGKTGEGPVLRTEIQALNRYIVTRSANYGIPVPANETLLALVQFHVCKHS